MGLLYYKFDVSDLSADERQSVLRFLDIQAHTGSIIDVKDRNSYYGFFGENISLDDFKKLFPSLSKCRITRAIP